MKLIIGIVLVFVLLFAGCTQNPGSAPAIKNQTNQFTNSSDFNSGNNSTVSQPAVKTTILASRDSSIPANATKITQNTDIYPPKMNSSEWETPVPLPVEINTAGAEDSPFITPDGNTLYFFFTPDPSIPAQKQLLDGVTGIWMSKKSNGQWAKAERVVLQDQGKLSLDGCEFVQGNRIWFCSAREGYSGINWFTAEYQNGKWQNITYLDGKFIDYEVGELHFSGNGSELYFHSGRAGGKGNYDVWMSKVVAGVLQPPVNLAIINSPDSEGWPFLSQDGNELWITRIYFGSPALFRSKLVNGTWSEPQLIVSQFAGEATLDEAGNLYFVHHYYKNGTMLEADIYFAKKK